MKKPNPVPVQSKAWICCRWLAGIAGSNPAGGMAVFLLWVFWCVLLLLGSAVA